MTEVDSSITACAEGTVTPESSGAEWWQRFFELSDDAQIVCDQDGNISQANRRALHLLNATGGPIPPGSNVTAPLQQSDQTALLDALAGNGSEPLTLNSIAWRHNNDIHCVDFRILRLSSAARLLTIRDATERLGLQSRSQRLAQAMDASPDICILTDTEWRIVFANSAFAALSGHAHEDVLGKPLDTLRCPSNQSAVKACRAAVQCGESWKGEFENVGADGTTFPVEASVSPIYDARGDLLGYMSAERDLSQRRRLQAELQRERDFALGIINSFDAAVYVTDCDFRLTHFNEGWRRFPAEHGGVVRTGEPGIGACLLDWFPNPAIRHAMERRFAAVLRTGRAEEFRTASSDKRRWLVKVGTCVHAGAVAGLIYTVIDETDHHQLQQQLYQAQKMETIGALAAGIAHDFNNLLQAILGNAGLLMLETVECAQTVRDSVQQITEAAERAAAITRRLLVFSRSAEETLAIIDLNNVVREVHLLLQRSARAKTQVDVSLSSSPATVSIDSTRAHQVLLNLCVNAQDAMEHGGTVRICVEEAHLSQGQAQTHGSRTGAPYIRCSVQDTGSGIPPEVLPRIFDPFFTTKRAGKGTGLGLAIVQSIVTQAGGFIEVQSKVAEGTVFQVYLPKAQELLPETKPAHAQRAERGSGRILVVDDTDLVREFTLHFLKEFGFEVVAVPDGRRAIEALAKAPADLLFTDYSMPGMNGVQLIEHVLSRSPGMRCILASGYVEQDERDRIHQLGARILNKPYTISQAIHLVQDVLHGRSPR